MIVVNNPVAELFDAWAKEYDQDAKGLLRYNGASEVYRAVQPYVQKGMMFLDAGVGTGLLSSLVKQHNDIHVTGVDLSINMLDVCRQKKCTDELHQVDLNKDKIPFSDNRFDIAATSGLVEFIYPLGRFLQEMARVTKPGGLVAITYEVSPDRDLAVDHMEARSYAYSPKYIADHMEQAGISAISGKIFDGYRRGLLNVPYGLFLGQVS